METFCSKENQKNFSKSKANDLFDGYTKVIKRQSSKAKLNISLDLSK